MEVVTLRVTGIKSNYVNLGLGLTINPMALMSIDNAAFLSFGTYYAGTEWQKIQLYTYSLYSLGSQLCLYNPGSQLYCACMACHTSDIPQTYPAAR